MENETDYGDEIQSPDEEDEEEEEEEEEEEAEVVGEPAVEGDVDERDGIEENEGNSYGDGSDDGDEDGAEEENDINNEGEDHGDEHPENEKNMRQPSEALTEDYSNDNQGSDIRSPSIANSNISDDEMEDDDHAMEYHLPVQESKNLSDLGDSNSSMSKADAISAGGMGDTNASTNQEEDTKSEKVNEDKESSYHSSPPESPSPIQSPEHAENVPINNNSLNHVISRSPKTHLEDQEGELDFEEELPERKEDLDSGSEQKTCDDIISKEKKESTKQSKDDVVPEKVEADDDDGEVEDDDDLEEGEVKDGSSSRKVPQRPMCRFFTKGQCTWGSNCRFLHPGINDKGNYNMFASPKPLVPSNGPGIMGPGFNWHGSGPRISESYHGRGYVDVPPPPPLSYEEPVYESAWERGLRHAKEILKKANKRKEMEPDFEDKRMNLSLSGEGTNEYEKENDYYNRSPYGHSGDPYGPYGYEDHLDPYDRQAHEYWRGGNYENFEVRYTRSDYEYRDHERLRERDRERLERIRERDREREREMFRDRERDMRSRREKFERPHSPERNWREERYIEPQVGTRARGDEWRDPWRRSTSPKRRNLSRSFSSHSSASYSSSRSSASRSSSYSSGSRSSSASSQSSYSSRSYSHSRSHSKTPIKHKGFTSGSNVPIGPVQGMPQRKPKALLPGHVPSPSKVLRPPVDKRPTAPVSSATQPNTTTPPVIDRKMKADKIAHKMMIMKQQQQQQQEQQLRERSLSSSGSGSGSSHSRSRSSHSGTSHSQTRSSSVSSLESVSSKSSISSKSTCESDVKVTPHGSVKKEKRSKMKPRLHLSDPAWKSSTERQRSSKSDSQLDRVKSAVNAPRASKDPLKQSGQKPQIKLTLLNKPQEKTNAASGSSLPVSKEGVPEIKKEKLPIAPEKAKIDMKKVDGPVVAGRKRPLSPVSDGSNVTSSAPKALPTSSSRTSGAVSKSTTPSLSGAGVSGKKSTSSRREELLKQLKAVEDAIARKRAKLA